MNGLAANGRVEEIPGWIESSRQAIGGNEIIEYKQMKFVDESIKPNTTLKYHQVKKGHIERRNVALKMPTAALAEATVPNAELYGLNTTNNGRLVLFGGGIPLMKDGKVVGAVGASGSAVEHDVKVSEAAVRAFDAL